MSVVSEHMEQGCEMNPSKELEDTAAACFECPKCFVWYPARRSGLVGQLMQCRSCGHEFTVWMTLICPLLTAVRPLHTMFQCEGLGVLA